jgi:hypothetical protein
MIVPAGPVRSYDAETRNLLSQRYPQEAGSVPEPTARLQRTKYGRMSEVLKMTFPDPIGWTIQSAMKQFKRAVKDYWQSRPGLVPRDVISAGTMTLITERPDKERGKFGMVLPASQELINPLDPSTIDDALDKLAHNFQAKWEAAELHGSGHTILGVQNVQCHINAGQRALAEAPYRGAAWVELPKELTDKRCVLNIKNDDSRCFQWCIVAKEMLDGGWHPDPKHAERVSYLQRGDTHPGRDRDSKRRRLNPAPVDVGLDFSMFPADDWSTVDIQSQLEEWGERNNYGVFLFEWHEIRKEDGSLRAAQATLYRRPGRRFAKEVSLLLYKERFCLVTSRAAWARQQ